MHLYLAEQRNDLVLVLFLAMFVVDTVTHTLIIIFHTCSLKPLYRLDMCLRIRPGYETQKLAWSIDDIMSFTVATKTFHKPCSIIWLNIEWAEVTAGHGNGHYMPICGTSDIYLKVQLGAWVRSVSQPVLHDTTPVQRFILE